VGGDGIEQVVTQAQPACGAVFTWPPSPLPDCDLAGCKDGRLNWTYPEEFLGLGSSHRSKPPRHPGEVIGTTRLLGRSTSLEFPSDVDRAWTQPGASN
jgi:hypothetical protein